MEISVWGQEDWASDQSRMEWEDRNAEYFVRKIRKRQIVSHLCRQVRKL
jgi:hypothetical protein